MSRTLSTPLSAEDLVYLRERYADGYVERLIELQGTEDGALEAAKESEAQSAGEPTDNGSEAGDGAQNGSEEDLIGLFDPSEHTEAEIKDHLEANPDDHDRVLAAEAEGRGRKGVLAL